MNTTHGMRRFREYRIWADMKQRCSNPKREAWKYYGAKGIKVCSRWVNSFAAFYSDMGRCPVGMSIDRKDNDGDYEPSNCRWATASQQASNRRIKTDCRKRGHELTLENTGIDSRGRRFCRACRKMVKHLIYERHKLEASRAA